MIFLLDDDIFDFPSADLAEEDGLIAVGGDLIPDRLINAYSSGIFPWYSDGEPIMWWSLDPRMVMKPTEIKVSKSLRRTIKSGGFSCSIDSNFDKVIEMCSSVCRKGENGTWITDEMIAAYKDLHRNGFDMIDAQQDTAHFRSLGGYTIPRKEYLQLLSGYVKKPTLVGNWGDGSASKKLVIIR